MSSTLDTLSAIGAELSDEDLDAAAGGLMIFFPPPILLMLALRRFPYL